MSEDKKKSPLGYRTPYHAHTQTETDLTGIVLYSKAGIAYNERQIRDILSEIESREAQTAVPKTSGILDDLQIDATFDKLPDGVQGFLKSWGFRQFAREIEQLVIAARVGRVPTEKECKDVFESLGYRTKFAKHLFVYGQELVRRFLTEPKDATPHTLSPNAVAELMGLADAYADKQGDEDFAVNDPHATKSASETKRETAAARAALDVALNVYLAESAEKVDQAGATIEAKDYRYAQYMMTPQEALKRYGAPAQPYAPATGLIVRDVCELDPADPKEPATLCVSVEDLTRIIGRYLPTAVAADAKGHRCAACYSKPTGCAACKRIDASRDWIPADAKVTTDMVEEARKLFARWPGGLDEIDAAIEARDYRIEHGRWPTETANAQDDEQTFEQAWAAYEKKGFQYGSDALEQVRFGWTIARAALSRQSSAPGHTDLMLSPESIDAFLEENPPPQETTGNVIQEFLNALDEVLRIEERKTWTSGYKVQLSFGDRYLVWQKYREARAALEAQGTTKFAWTVKDIEAVMDSLGIPINTEELPGALTFLLTAEIYRYDAINCKKD